MNLKQKEYWKIFCNCNIGIGSLAMYRNGLTDGCTLKVREMLLWDYLFPAIKIPLYQRISLLFSEGGNIEDIIKFYQSC